MPSAVDRFQRDYRVLLLRYVPRRDEAVLHSAYTLGRDAVGEGLSMLDVVQVHHAVLLEVLADRQRDEELPDIATAASELLIEVLSVYEMAHRR